MEKWVLKPGVGRIIAALVLDAVTAAGITSIPGALGGPFIIFVFFVALIPWSIGVVALGGPVWWLMHRAGYRSPAAAVVSSGAITFLGVIAMGASRIAWYGMLNGAVEINPSVNWDSTLILATLLCPIGAVGGLVAQKVAYRRAVPA